MNVSASQIADFRLCERKWALKKIGGLTPAPHPLALRGTEVHSLLEKWVATGEPLPSDPDGPGPIAMPALRHIAAPGDPTADQEIWFEFPSPTIDGVFYRGFIDLAWQPDGMPPRIVDYKTTGADMKWAKSQSELREDVQATLYAYAGLMELFPGQDVLDLQWLYLARSKPRAKPVQLRIVRDPDAHRPEQAFGAVVTLDEVQKNFERIELTVKRMLAVTEDCSGDAMRAPPNANACGAFGGCPFRDTCKLTAKEALRSIVAQSLAEKLKARKTAQEAPTPAPVAETKAEDVVNSPPRTKSVERREAAQRPPGVAPGLRDAMAAAALTGLLAARTAQDPEEAANEAYAYADACLKARG